MSSPRLLDRIERYFSLAPLADAQVRTVGPLQVPIGSPEWPYPARPLPGREGEVTLADVRAAVALQEQAGLPAALEWLGDRCRGLATVARSAGLAVDELPLLVADDPVEVLLPAEVRLYLVGADDPRLGLYQRLADLARYVVEKGSITVDGVSLTVSALADEPEPWFEVSLIPTTL
ncbi:hypothetical protein DMO24_22720, partial [Modestobacter versicolor]